MNALTAERLNGMIATAREKVGRLSVSELADLDNGMAVEFDEHYEYQQLQARFHATGMLTPEAAQIVYIALGECGSVNNGGWATNTDTATKVIVTQLMHELLQLSLKQRGLGRLV